jgi:hypothetical protein
MKPTTRLCHGCRHLSPRDAYCALWGQTRHAHDEACQEHSDDRVEAKVGLGGGIGATKGGER